MQAKFHVNDVLERKGSDGKVSSQIVRMNPITDRNPESPDHTFWLATPSGSLEMTINNEKVFDWFKPGKVYLLEFTEQA